MLHSAHNKCAFFSINVNNNNKKEPNFSLPFSWIMTKFILRRGQIILWVISNLDLEEVAAVVMPVWIILIFNENKCEKTERPFFQWRRPKYSMNII